MGDCVRKYYFLFFLFFIPNIVFAKSTSVVVMDVNSGRVLYSEHENDEKLIASTTKIMTCIIVLENIQLDKRVTIGDEVLDSYGTNIYIKPGEVMSVEDLLYGLMLRSGNDAALTLAVQLFDSEEQFVERMNEKAKDLGMKHTHFSNCHGLDDKNENYSTAYDLAILSQYAYQNSIYRKIISTKKYETKSSLKSYVWYNRVSLLSSYSKCLGGKNGYTPKAGKSLVSLAENQGLTLTIVSLNDSLIYDHHKELYESIFSKYQNYKIVDSHHFSISPDLISKQKVYVKDDFIYPLMEKELNSISTLVSIYNVSSNSIVGEIQVFLNHDLIGKVPIYEKKQKKEECKTFFCKFRKLFV